jgi:acyl carrier protein
MNQEEILERVQLVFRQCFDNDTLVIERKTTASDVENWDSLNHVNLLAAIEKEFGFEFTLTEMGGLKNVGEMVDLIQQIVSEK